MIGGIIVSHGKLAEELLNALTIILGEVVNMEAISIGWYDDVEDSKRKINQALKRVDQKNGVLIFTDMFGGTPSNLSYSFLEEDHIEVLSGVNLPVLIEAIASRDKLGLTELANKLEATGKKSITLASGVLKGNKRG